MRSPKLRGALGIVSSMVVAASVVLACTHDFDAYEPGDGVVVPPTVDGQAVDAAKPSTGDGSVTPTDGSVVKDSAPPVDCTTKTACGTTEASCMSTCDQTRTTCAAGCAQGGPGNKCRNDCNDARDNCNSTCHNTCRTCATSACSASICN